MIDSKSLMENNKSYIFSSIFESYLLHKNPTCFSCWSVFTMLSLQQRIQEVLDIGLAEVDDRYVRGQAEVDELRDEFPWL